MGYSLENKLVIALSPAALFGADGESFGCAMPLAKGLSRLEFQGESPVELIVVSRGDAASSLPVFKRAADMGLGIIRGAFIADGELCPYLAAMGADIFLSENPEDVQQAIDAGFAAAVTAPCPALRAYTPDHTRARKQATHRRAKPARPTQRDCRPSAVKTCA